MFAFLQAALIVSAVGAASDCSAPGAAAESCVAQEGDNLVQIRSTPTNVTGFNAKFYTYNQGNPDREEAVSKGMFDLLAEDMASSPMESLDFVTGCWQENDDAYWISGFRKKNNFCGSSRGCTHPKYMEQLEGRLKGAGKAEDNHYKKGIKRTLKYGAELEIFDKNSAWTFDTHGGWTGKGGVVGCRNDLLGKKKVVVICAHLSTSAANRAAETKKLLEMADVCIKKSGATDSQQFFLGDLNYRLRFKSEQDGTNFLTEIKKDFFKYPSLAPNHEDLPTLAKKGAGLPLEQAGFLCDPVTFPTYPRAKDMQATSCLGATKQDTFDCWKYKGENLKFDKHSKDGNVRLTLGQLDRLCWSEKSVAVVSVSPKRFYDKMSDHIMVGFDVSFQ